MAHIGVDSCLFLKFTKETSAGFDIGGAAFLWNGSDLECVGQLATVLRTVLGTERLVVVGTKLLFLSGSFLIPKSLGSFPIDDVLGSEWDSCLDDSANFVGIGLDVNFSSSFRWTNIFSLGLCRWLLEGNLFTLFNGFSKV